MKVILIANVGNRNLTYRGNSILKELEGLKITYREFTKALVLGNQEAELNVAIIDVIFNAYKSKLNKVLLIASNQAKGANRDFDTYYAAELIKRKIRRTEAWNHLEVEILEMPISLENTSEIMSWYKRSLTRIYAENGNAEYVICDAGGAPQMKTPLKILAEFIFPLKSLSIKYVVQHSGELVDVEQVEYRKVIVAYQIESLIQSLQYRAAVELWAGLAGLSPDKDRVLLFLQFAAARSELLTADATNFGRRLLGRLKNAPCDLKDFTRGAVERSGMFNLPDKQLFQAVELLHLIAYNTSQNNLNALVLQSRQFEELMLAVLIEGYLDIPLISAYGKGVGQLVAFAIARHLKLGERTIESDSVPARIAVAKFIDDPAVQLLVRSFERVELAEKQSLGILRNALVHDGKSVTSKKVLEFCPSLPKVVEEWLEIFGLSDVKIYADMNTEMVALLKQSV